MRTSVLCILLALALVVVLLTPDPVQGWRRRRRRRRWIRIRGRRLVRTIGKAIKVYKVLSAGKKRAVAAATDPLTEEGLLQHVDALVTSCPEKLESTLTDLTKQFEEADANSDDTLTGDELTNFNTFLGTYNACQ